MDRIPRECAFVPSVASIGPSFPEPVPLLFLGHLFFSIFPLALEVFFLKNRDKNSYTFVVSSSKDKFKAKQKGAATGPVRCIMREIPQPQIWNALAVPRISV